MKLLSFILLTFLLSCGGKKQNESVLEFEKVNIVADRFYLWSPKQTIIFQFKHIDSELESLIREVAIEWTKYANLNFVFYSAQNPVPKFHYEIHFVPPQEKVGFAGQSDVGKRDTDNPGVMKFALRTKGLNYTKRKRKKTILHEFGHMLGLQHEHHSVNRPFMIKVQYLIDNCESRFGFLSFEKCLYNIQQKFNESESISLDNYIEKSQKAWNRFKREQRWITSDYDPESIMHYDFHFLKDSDLIKGEVVHKHKFVPVHLSLRDKLSVVLLYPGRKSQDDVVFEHIPSLEDAYVIEN